MHRGTKVDGQNVGTTTVVRPGAHHVSGGHIMNSLGQRQVKLVGTHTGTRASSATVTRGRNSCPLQESIAPMYVTWPGVPDCLGVIKVRQQAH